MGLFSSIFGKSADFVQLVKDGAVILDVRTPGEYAGGHIKGSKNIPLQSIQQNLSKIPKDKVIITCCASGMRSGSAKSILLSSGFKEVHNGGGWMSLKGKL
ncbi:MAG: rhodanese-like domain-containing protein [Cryomorphaceae bacterium]|nr:rhodanese-like domain-containing protein [Cryomorphaceae bacterium]